MIELLENELRAAWPEIGGSRPQPRRVHFAKLSHDDYPPPESALLVLLFADRDTRPVAVAKVARVPAGDAAIEREAAALATVAIRLPEPLRRSVPRVLRAGRVNERAFLVAMALPGQVELHHTWSPAAAPRAAARMQAALDWIERAGAATAEGSVRGASWFGCEPHAALASLARLGCTPRALERLELLLPQLWASEWPACMAHGDYFAGNLLFDRAGGVGVVDWMLFEARAPRFFDPLTYELSFGLHQVQRGTAPSPAARRAVHELPAFVAARGVAAAAGLEIGLESDARRAVLVHGALRDGTVEPGREGIARAWAALLSTELETPSK